MFVCLMPQAIGAYGSGTMDIEELGEVERCSLPGSGACGEGVVCGARRVWFVEPRGGGAGEGVVCGG